MEMINRQLLYFRYMQNRFGRSSYRRNAAQIFSQLIDQRKKCVKKEIPGGHANLREKHQSKNSF
jgi:hypothetical protein